MKNEEKLILGMLVTGAALFVIGFAAAAFGGPVEDMINDMQQRVDERPEISQQFYLTVVYAYPKTERCRELKSFIERSSAMRTIIQQVNFNSWDDTSPMVNNTPWGVFIGKGRPALIFQAPADDKGRAEIIYFQKGDDLPIGPELIDRIRIALEAYTPKYKRRCPGGRCPIVPRNPVTPDPAPPAVVEPVVPAPLQPTPVTPEEPEPDPEPANKEDGDYIPLLLFLVVPAAAGLGAWKAFQAESNEEALN